MKSFLTGNIWKIATGGAVLAILLVSALLMASQFENKDLLKQRNTLVAQINDPETGYIAQLAQARTNVVTLQTTVQRQNAAYQELSKRSETQLDATRAALAAAQSRTRTMERELAQFMATKPQGATLEERIQDIDRRAVEEFLP